MLVIVLNSLSPENDEQHRKRYKPLVKLYRQFTIHNKKFNRTDDTDYTDHN